MKIKKELYVSLRSGFIIMAVKDLSISSFSENETRA
jgi:hypothetical protein